MLIKGQVTDIYPMDNYYKVITVKRRRSKKTESFDFYVRRNEYNKLLIADIVRIKFDKKAEPHEQIKELWVLQA